MKNHRALFDRLYADNDDPWGFRTRWYEARKRAITLASLPAARYRCAYEPGCANGELAAALAPRCDALRVSDGSQAAVDLSVQRLAQFEHVQVMQEWLPDDWPSARFDLIVLSEMGFYLDQKAVETVALQARHSLCAGGALVACHWRHPVQGFELDGDRVHDLLDRHLRLTRLVHHREDDFVLDVWSDHSASVAEREGFV